MLIDGVLLNQLFCSFVGIDYIFIVYKEAQSMPKGIGDNFSGRHIRKSPDVTLGGKLLITELYG